MESSSTSTTISANFISKRSRSPEPEIRKITLKVKNQQDGKEDLYKIGVHANLKKLMVAYCEKRNVDHRAVTFLYNFKAIKPRQTPFQLLMKDGDIVDMVMEQPGGGPYSAA